MRKFTLLFLSLYISNSWALSCNEPSSLEVVSNEFYKHIFTGTVLSAKVEGDSVVASFDISEIFKGNPQSLDNVSTSRTMGIIVGREYFFIVTGSGYFNICSGTSRVNWRGYSNEIHLKQTAFHDELAEYYRAYNKSLKQDK